MATAVAVVGVARCRWLSSSLALVLARACKVSLLVMGAIGAGALALLGTYGRAVGVACGRVA